MSRFLRNCFSAHNFRLKRLLLLVMRRGRSGRSVTWTTYLRRRPFMLFLHLRTLLTHRVVLLRVESHILLVYRHGRLDCRAIRSAGRRRTRRDSSIPDDSIHWNRFLITQNRALKPFCSLLWWSLRRLLSLPFLHRMRVGLAELDYAFFGLRGIEQRRLLEVLAFWRGNYVFWGFDGNWGFPWVAVGRIRFPGGTY